MNADYMTGIHNTEGYQNSCLCFSQNKTTRHVHRMAGKSNCLSNYCKRLPTVFPYVSKEFFAIMYESIDQNHTYENLRFNPFDSQDDTPARMADLVRNQGSLNDEGQRFCYTKIKARGANTGKPLAKNYQTENVRDNLIEMLRLRLLKSRFFSINEMHKAKDARAEQDEVDFYPQAIEQISISMTKMGVSQFVSLCNTEKNTSRSIQNLIEASTQDQMLHAFKLIGSSIAQLIVNPLGNYILQVAARRSSLVASELEHYCSNNIAGICSNEYASRVMQTLTEVSLTFRKSVLIWASENLGFLMEALPAVFVLTAAASLAQHPEELDCIRKTLLSSRARQYVHFRYFKRILMSFIDKCHFDDVSRVCELYKINKNFHYFLNDKFGAFILIAVIKRGFKPTTSLLYKYIRNDILGLYNTKFFKFVYYRLGIDAELKIPLLDAVLRMSPEKVLAATESRASCFFFCYLIASVASEDLASTLLHLQDQIQNYEKFRAILCAIAQQYRIRNY